MWLGEQTVRRLVQTSKKQLMLHATYLARTRRLVAGKRMEQRAGFEPANPYGKYKALFFVDFLAVADSANNDFIIR